MGYKFIPYLLNRFCIFHFPFFCILLIGVVERVQLCFSVLLDIRYGCLNVFFESMQVLFDILGIRVVSLFKFLHLVYRSACFGEIVCQLTNYPVKCSLGDIGYEATVMRWPARR